MQKRPRIAVSQLLLGSWLLSLAAWGQTSVRRVQVLGSKDAVEIEIEASDRLVPQTQVLTGPDRLVVDFPNAVPSSELRSQSVNRGEVKDVRFGLLQSKPPITRLVLDLKSPQSYQVFPSGRTVIVKVTGAARDTSTGVEDFPLAPATRPGLVVTNYTTGVEPVRVETAALPALQVSFHDGLLAIKANKANLSDVLFAVQQRTGSEISIAAGAEQEKVVTDIGPAPAPEVLARLLNGSKFNYLILSAANDPSRLDRVILSPRGEGGVTALPAVQNDDSADDDVPQTAPPAQNTNDGPPPRLQPQVPARPQPEMVADPPAADQ